MGGDLSLAGSYVAQLPAVCPPRARAGAPRRKRRGPGPARWDGRGRGSEETVCGLVLGAVEARMPLRGRRLDSEGLAGSGWHWSTPRRFEAV